MRRIGEHLAVDLLFDGLGVVGKVDTVAKGLAHLGLAVHTGKAALRLIFGYHGLRQHQSLAVGAVEFFYYLAGLLYHGKLVFPDGDYRGVERSDVRSLRDRVSEEACRKPLVGKAAHRDLGFYGRVPGKARCADQVHVVERERVQGRKLRLHAYGGLFRVQTYGEVVQDHVYYIVPDLSWVVCVVSKSLIIGYEYVYLVKLAGVLKLHAAL